MLHKLIYLTILTAYFITYWEGEAVGDNNHHAGDDLLDVAAVVLVVVAAVLVVAVAAVAAVLVVFGLQQLPPQLRCESKK